MNARDDTAAILARLSSPATDPFALSRRRFLQLALAAGASTSLLGSPLTAHGSRVALAEPEGILVVVLLAGGNDGATMVAPVGDPAYVAARGPLALRAGDVLPIAEGLGLHPRLPGVKRRFDAGDVAVLQGVGTTTPSLSHFESMARWMSGWSGGVASTGWIGRYLSTLAEPDPVSGVVIGSAVPLHFHGPTTSAVALPLEVGDAIGWLGTDLPESEFSTLDLLARFNDRNNERGTWANAWNAGLGDLVSLGSRTRPAYTTALPGDVVAANLTLAAKVINLGLGTRAVGVSFGDFDTHADQEGRLPALLGRFDDAVEAFFGALDPAVAGRVTLLTISEFGRRAGANSSGGTDHGAASSSLAIGAPVRGGIYGTTPSMSDLDADGNLRASVDFLAVYATALRWMGGDAAAVLGGDYPDLGFLPRWPSSRSADPIGGPVVIGRSSAFVPLPPARVLDTRGSGLGTTGGKLGPGGTVEVRLAGVGGIPAGGASAVVMNVTAAEADGPGFVTAWPGGDLPLASNVNLDAAGQTRPNLVTSPLGADGTTRLFASGGTHLLADVFGYFRSAAAATSGRFVAVVPTRMLDTRAGGAVGYEGSKPAGGDVVRLQIGGRAGVPATGADAVVLNVTVAEADGYGYVTVFPDGDLPSTSNLNVQHAGQTVANQVIVRLGADGAVRLFTYGSVHLLADLVGWFTGASAPTSSEGLFTPATPYRVLDTRGGNRRPPGSVLTLPVADPSAPAAGARAVVLNVTAVDAAGWGYVSVYPQGDPPATSTLNVDSVGQTIANHAICPVGSDGAIRLFTYGELDLVVDVAGWFR